MTEEDAYVAKTQREMILTDLGEILRSHKPHDAIRQFDVRYRAWGKILSTPSEETRPPKAQAAPPKAQAATPDPHRIMCREIREEIGCVPGHLVKYINEGWLVKMPEGEGYDRAHYEANKARIASHYEEWKTRKTRKRISKGRGSQIKENPDG